MKFKFPVRIGVPDEDPQKRHGVAANYEMVKFKHIFLREFNKIEEEILSRKSQAKEDCATDECCNA